MKYYGDLPVVILEGPPTERGLIHGRALGELIHTCLTIEREAHCVEKKDWEKILKQVEPYRQYLEREHLSAYQELEGIARGSDVPVNAIILINEGADEFWNDSCTTLVILPGAAQAGHTILGKNRDGPNLRLKTDALFIVIPETGLRYVTLAGIGTLARDGINECGLVLFGNGLSGPRDGQSLGVSFAVLRRYLLNQPTLGHMQLTLDRLPRRGSFNYTLASVSGEAMALEAAVKRLYRVDPLDGILVHTNHFVAAEAANISEQEVPWGARSRFRLERLRSILEPKAGSLMILDIQQALSDHEEYPGSVCSHRVELGQPGGTLNSYCVDLNDKTIYVANGPPCTTPYVPIPFIEIGLEFAPCA